MAIFACPFASGVSRHKASQPRRHGRRCLVLKLVGEAQLLGDAVLLLQLAELLARLVRSRRDDAVRGANTVGGANAIELWSVAVGWGRVSRGGAEALGSGGAGAGVRWGEVGGGREVGGRRCGVRGERCGVRGEGCGVRGKRGVR